MPQEGWRVIPFILCSGGSTSGSYSGCVGSSPDLKQLCGAKEEGDLPSWRWPRRELLWQREPESGSGPVRWEML